MLSCLLYRPDPISQVFLAYSSYTRASCSSSWGRETFVTAEPTFEWLEAHPRLLSLAQFAGVVFALTLSKLQEQPFLNSEKKEKKGVCDSWKHNTIGDFFVCLFGGFYYQYFLWFCFLGFFLGFFMCLFFFFFILIEYHNSSKAKYLTNKCWSQWIFVLTGYRAEPQHLGNVQMFYPDL